MFFTIIENFVFFSTFFALLAYGIVLTVRFMGGKGWIDFSPFALSRIYAWLILMPPILSLWLVLAALLPESLLRKEDFTAEHELPVHKWHLLTDLTSGLEPLLASVTVIFLIGVAVFIVWKSIHSYFRIGNIIRILEIEASIPAKEKISLVEEIAERHGIEVGLVMSEQPLTFVWGFWHSKLVLSSGLLNSLDSLEIRGVIEHEAAHHVRRDNLVKLCLSVASYMSPLFPLTRRVLGWQAEQIELVCDEIAAFSTKEPLEIASALVKVKRRLPELEIGLPSTSAFMNEETISIEPRVKRLVNLTDSFLLGDKGIKSANKPLTEAISLSLFFVLSLTIIMFLSPLAVHRTAEALIQFIKY